MGAAPSTAAPPSAATTAVCDAIERVVHAHADYAHELHDFAVQRMEADTAAAMADSKASQSERKKQATTRSQALKTAMQDRLLADFLAPNARFHADMCNEISHASGGSKSPQNQNNSATAAAAAAASASASAAAAGSGSAAAAAAAGASSTSAAAFAALPPAEQERAIRAGVDLQVQRVWTELEIAKHYDSMSAAKSFAQKEAQLQQALVATFDELEF